LKTHYRWYCKILKDVIREAKKQYYNRQVLNSSNKIKTVWDITKSVTGKLTKVDTIQKLKVNGEVMSKRQDIADSVNSFFLSVAENNTNKNFKTNCKPLDYL
jgi:adenylyl- and sulfurtransferase ThiI